MPAGVALKTRHVMMKGHTLAHFKTAHSRPLAHNSPGGFVAEHPWRGDGPVLYFLDVRRTDTAGRHFDQDFVASNSRNRQGFQPQIISAAVNHGAHHAGNGGGHGTEDT